MPSSYPIADREVEVDRLAILKKLKADRKAYVKAHKQAVAAHPQVILAALDAWKVEVAAFEIAHIWEIEDGVEAARKLQQKLNLPSAPQSRVHLYDEMIEILEAEIRETVLLTGHEIRFVIHGPPT